MAAASYPVLYHHDIANWEDKAAGLVDVIWYRDSNHRMSYDSFSDSLFTFYFSSSMNEETDEALGQPQFFPQAAVPFVLRPRDGQLAARSTAMFYDIQEWMLCSPTDPSPSPSPSPPLPGESTANHPSYYPASRYSLFPSLYNDAEPDPFTLNSDCNRGVPCSWLADILKRTKVNFGVFVTALYYMDRAAKLKSGSAVHYCQNCRMDLLDCCCWQKRSSHRHGYASSHDSSSSSHSDGFVYHGHSHSLATRSAVFLVNTAQMRNFPFSYKMYSYSCSGMSLLPERGAHRQGSRCSGLCSANVEVYQRRRYRLFAIIFIMIACKYHQDRHYSNQVWAELSGFHLQLVNVSERAALCALGFDLRVDKSVGEYSRWYEYCRKLLYACSESSFSGTLAQASPQPSLCSCFSPISEYAHVKRAHACSHAYPFPHAHALSRSLIQPYAHSQRLSSISERSRLRRNSKSRRHF